MQGKASLKLNCYHFCFVYTLEEWEVQWVRLIKSDIVMLSLWCVTLWWLKFLFLVFIFDRNFNLNLYVRIFWGSQGSNPRPHREVRLFGERDYHLIEFPKWLGALSLVMQYTCFYVHIVPIFEENIRSFGWNSSILSRAWPLVWDPWIGLTSIVRSERTSFQKPNNFSCFLEHYYQPPYLAENSKI